MFCGKLDEVKEVVTSGIVPGTIGTLVKQELMSFIGQLLGSGPYDIRLHVWWHSIHFTECFPDENEVRGVCDHARGSFCNGIGVPFSPGLLCAWPSPCIGM